MRLADVLDQIDLIITPLPPPPPIVVPPPPPPELVSECFVISFATGAPDKMYVLSDADMILFIGRIPEGAAIVSQIDCSDTAMSLNVVLDDINFILNPELMSEQFEIVFANMAPNKTYVLTDAEFALFLTQIPPGATILMGSQIDSDLPSDGLQFVLDDILLILNPPVAGPVPAAPGELTGFFAALSGTSTGADGRRVGLNLTNLTDKEVRLTMRIITIGPFGSTTNNQTRDVSLLPMEARTELFDDFFTSGRPRGLFYISTITAVVPGTNTLLFPEVLSRFIFR